jgi:predicted RNase H-like HicB family nuclease
MKKKLTRVIRKHGRWHIAYVTEIPGVNTQGRSRRSARRNLEEALVLIRRVRAELLFGRRRERSATISSA